MEFNARKNIDSADIIAMINASSLRAVRRIKDSRNGDLWYWPAELGTHAEGASALGVPYDTPPGLGDILTD